MKIAFVYVPSPVGHPRSPETGCERLAKLFPTSLFVSDTEANYEQLREDGYRIFCHNHTPHLYKNRKISRGCLDDVMTTRAPWAKLTIGIRNQSGFSYLKQYINLYDCYFPTIYTFTIKTKPTTPCVGYYNRACRYDTTNEFIEFANTIPKEIPIITMGEPLTLNRPHTHTINDYEFFSKCTHYFYMKSIIQEDPFPHTLMQACQCGCNILMPSTDRNWKDGIDDIIDVCDVEVIDTRKYKYPWEMNKPCSFAPRGEDFSKLHKLIGETWHWLPSSTMKTFSDLYNYAIGL